MVEKKKGDNQMGKAQKQNNNSSRDKQPFQGIRVSLPGLSTLIFSSVIICGT